MKQIIILLFIATLLNACKGDDKDSKETPANTDEKKATEVQVKGMETAAGQLEQKVEALRKLPQLSIEEMKALLPEELEGIKRTNFNASATMGYTYVGGDYKKNKSTFLEIKLFDCAGETGAAFYSSGFGAALQLPHKSDKILQENAEEYSKIVMINGVPGIERHRKDNNRTLLTYMGNERILVTLDGQNMSPEELKAVASRLTFRE